MAVISFKKAPARFLLRRDLWPWAFLLLLISCALIIPFIGPLMALFTKGSEVWTHLRTTVLKSYISDTVVLALGVLALSSLLAVLPAWMISRFAFPLRKFFDAMLVFPLAIPAYVSAYAYSGFFGHFGTVHRFFQLHFPAMENPPVFNITTMGGLIFVMSLALYPYIYLIMRPAFSRSCATAVEASRTLGAGFGKQLLAIALPLSRTAYVAGAAIVLMELLNEYGAVVYYGQNTVTTGIFRAWFGFYDLTSARRLGAFLMLAVFFLLSAERLQRRKKGFGTSGQKSIVMKPLPVSGLRNFFLPFIAALPVLLGFIIPIFQLFKWASISWGSIAWAPIFKGITNSLLLGITGSLVIMAGSLIIAYSRWLVKNPLLRRLSDLSLLGYSLPGAVIALGVITVATLFKGNPTASSFFSGGSVILLVYAYCVRFQSIGQRPVSDMMEHKMTQFNEASRILGNGPIKTLASVLLPNLRGALLAGFALSFLEMVKELPLTIVLRPFNFTTLSVRTYELASNEMLHEAAVPALILVGIGSLGVLLIQRILGKSRKE